MSQSRPDVIVIGGGVFGLWVARRALQAGLRVELRERRRLGGGASGGLLGALTAHTPDRWSPKKAFQLEALAALPAECARLEAETGVAVGYRRSGRVMPIRSTTFRAQVAARSRGAATHWAAQDPSWIYAARDGVGEAVETAGWLATEAAPCGFVHDTLAALVAPRRYMAALSAAVRRDGARVVEGASAEPLELLEGRAGAVVIAAGFESFGLEPRLAAASAPLGGVKGRSALFELPGWEGRPLIYDDGVYVCPHGDGRVAVGSTDEKDWRAEDGATTESAFEVGADPSGPLDFIVRAQALCPPLRDRAPTEIWAGVRPKTRARDPILGRLAPDATLWVASGGFKIGLGVAHLAAAALIDRLTDAPQPTPLPPTFEAGVQLGWSETPSNAGGGGQTGHA